MRRAKFRPRARADLRAIGDYSDARWGKERGELYLADIAEALDRIVAMPHIGSQQDEVAPSLRKWRVGSHHIYYRVVDDDVVLIIRVLHERMDAAQAKMTLQSPVSSYRAEA